MRARRTEGVTIPGYRVRLQEVEADVTRYMVENFSFAVLHFDDEADRRQYEENLLSTIYACPDCGPSEIWLGKYHPNSQVIRECGLWNVQGLGGAVLSRDDAKRLVVAGLSTMEG